MSLCAKTCDTCAFTLNNLGLMSAENLQCKVAVVLWATGQCGLALEWVGRG